MPGIYKVFTAFVAVIGNVSLIISGEINPAFVLLGTGLLPGYYRSIKKQAQLPRRIIGRLALVTFIVFLIDLAWSGDIFIAVAQMTLVFQSIKSFDIKDPWDPPQVFFMSLLQVLIASEISLSTPFGALFILFIIFIIIAIVLGHLVKEGETKFRPYLRAVVIVTIVTTVLTAAIFVVLPRFRSGLWGRSFTKGIRTAGFDEKVDLGSFGEIKKDETVVIRMILDPDIEGPHYLRGMTFDYFDGSAWYDSIDDFRTIYRTTSDYIRDVPKDAPVYEAEILLEPIASDVIFTFKKPFGFKSQGRWMRRDSAGSFYMRMKSSKRFNYTLLSYEGYYRDNEFIPYYLQYPEGMSSIRGLAERIVAGKKSDIERARSIQKYLLENYTYSLSTERPPAGLTPIEYFLFGSKKGYCEHFATAMVLLLRSSGIPARLVTGFLGGEKNEFGGYYLIRQSGAHSWVEAYINDKWMDFDPTPPVESVTEFPFMLFVDMVRLNWNRYVVGFSNYDQTRMFTFFREVSLPELNMPSHQPLITVLVVFLFLAGIVYGLLKWRPSSAMRLSRISAEYMRFRMSVSKAGGAVGPASTSRDVLSEALRTGRFEDDDVKDFIELYRVLRFSEQGKKTHSNAFFQLAVKLRK